ncbi:catechol 2,3-dioxygenase-like lactoylglutathione lyase family enzyme [Halorubrum alkaliphilum]|uniref:Catechol 2,3-dioxygenase-like lactoylglutathione lyase family enzyme n=1 Tax=Halorubrum alkaliphilum TaxID=261290 RepID=A0A8T4GBK1_9EURY|nr:carboxylate--amine ligase [Halorubrum alkaliphilum]MBP1921109.1 catechol 2,3-dioxygenase-like lactoylglutathione lyase family enzyme [Halorubrum alkaliphilum]
MADRFHSTQGLIDALTDASFDCPPALVSNAHVTGLGVARALDAHDVPVIALDRPANGGSASGSKDASRPDGGAEAATVSVTHDGLAPPSDAVDFAGAVTYPLDDLDGFREDVEAIVDAAGREAVAFGCMDEWALAYAEADPDGVRLPYAGIETVDDVLNKSQLYATCEELGVPYPETHRLGGNGGEGSVDDADLEAAADALGFPLVVKPARKREFEEAFGTNVIEVADEAEFRDTVAAAAAAGVEVMAQKRVDIATGEDRSLASYVPPSGVDDALAVVGNAAVRYPRQFGTSCLVETVADPEIEARALGVLDDAGYHGISEAEFVYDREREEYLLLDVNTRPWKWISLPVAAGANLPMAAYAAVTDAEYESTGIEPARWVYLRDYLAALSGGEVGDLLGGDDWRALVSGKFEAGRSLTTGIYRPSDPAPTAKLFETEFDDREYYCSC